MKPTNLQENLMERIEANLIGTGLIHLREGAELDGLQQIQEAIRESIHYVYSTDSEKLFDEVADHIYKCQEVKVSSDGLLREVGVFAGEHMVCLNVNSRKLVIYNTEDEIVAEFTKNSEELLALKMLFDEMRL